MDEPLDDQTELAEEWIRARLGKAAQIPIDVDLVIARLADQQAHLADHLDRRWDDLGPGRLARLLATYAANAVRLGRLLRDRAPVGGKMSEEQLDLLLKIDRDDEDPDAEPAAADQPDPDAPPLCVDDVIAGLDRLQARLGHHLDRLWRDPDASGLDRLLAVYGRNASRLGQLLRYRCDIYGPPPDPLELAIDMALYSLGQKWGINLLGDAYS